jgi:ferredoxin
MTRKLDVSIDTALCVGNQMCVQAMPTVFSATAGGQAEVAGWGTAREADLVDTALNCPVGAIVVTDAETGESLLD